MHDVHMPSSVGDMHGAASDSRGVRHYALVVLVLTVILLLGYDIAMASLDGL